MILYSSYLDISNVAQYIFCDIGSPSERLKQYDRIYNSSCTGASLSSRAEFRVRTPVPKNPIQTKFHSIDPNTPVWLDHGSKFSVGSEPAKVQKRRDYRKPNPRSDLNDIE